MKIQNIFISLICALVLIPAAAQAFVTEGDFNRLNAGAAAVSTGKIPVVQNSQLQTVTVDQLTAAGLAGFGITASATEINYNDITTLGTIQASKTYTTDASNDSIFPSTYLGTYASGSAATFASGATLTVAGTEAITGTLTVDGVTVNKKQLSLPGRVDITICGDGTTINNNTVYYGPSMVPVANAGRTCDITQVGNVTEATADAPALDNTAIQVLSMDCLTADPGAAGVSFTLRNNAAATVPSVTCSVANTKLGCTGNVQTTAAIAAGNPIAIAAASTGNQGTTPFVCTIHAAY